VCISTGDVSTMHWHVQVCTLDRCCEHQRTHCLHARYRMCISAHVCAVCSFSVGQRRWGGSASLWKHLLLGVGVIFDRRKGKGSVCVFFIFNVGGSVCGCMCVYTHTHTHCTDGVLRCAPRSRDETPGGPEESRWTKSRHTYFRICVQSTHMYVYATRRDEILGELLFSSIYVFFRKRKQKM